MKLLINSDESLSKAIGELRGMFREHKYLRLAVKTGRDRSLDQNAIAHAWYAQVARELREDTAAKVKRYCKLHHGVPILRAADDEFRSFYDMAIKGLPYEKKLIAMDHLDVTSIMTVPQMSEYLVDVQSHFAARSVELKFPEPDQISRRAA